MAQASDNQQSFKHKKVESMKVQTSSSKVSPLKNQFSTHQIMARKATEIKITKKQPKKQKSIKQQKKQQNVDEIRHQQGPKIFTLKRSTSQFGRNPKIIEQKLKTPEKNGIKFRKNHRSISNINPNNNQPIKPNSGSYTARKNNHSSENFRSVSSRNLQKRNDEFPDPLISKNVSSGKSKSVFAVDSKKTIPQQIQQYLKKRQDVEVVQFFEQYKKQFFIKSKLLHEYIYESDEPQKVKNMYLNEGDTHFINGLQCNMLKLFRDGTIVPQSYNNLRQEAVNQIEKWVIGWIHRKINYGRLVQEEDQQIDNTQKILDEITEWSRKVGEEDTSF